MSKQVTLQLPEGYKLDTEKSTPLNIVLKKIEQKRWEDFGEVKGYYITYRCFIGYCEVKNSVPETKHVIPTEKEAKAVLALIQLMQWRDKANGEKLEDWCDWEDSGKTKSTIRNINNILRGGVSCSINAILTFKTPQIRDQFMIDHRDLLETAKPLL